eukprot:TRINITY_DN5034_c0_g1_i11.p1 TRINITY_DN5034_c0_g1~~TRINITY_DN5034_c0_g1_i11.p1  ORF type:complete len:264 (-),score=41.53 TRINITY_DN5034_c0_g1_i11:92-838(-)
MCIRDRYQRRVHGTLKMNSKWLKKEKQHSVKMIEMLGWISNKLIRGAAARIVRTQLLTRTPEVADFFLKKEKALLEVIVSIPEVLAFLFFTFAGGNFPQNDSLTENLNFAAPENSLTTALPITSPPSAGGPLPTSPFLTRISARYQAPPHYVPTAASQAALSAGPTAARNTGPRVGLTVAPHMGLPTGTSAFPNAGIPPHKSNRVTLVTIYDELISLNTTLSGKMDNCLLYTSPSPRDLSTSRMPSSA